ncbi:MAG TPA: TCR/Tet family MFS transporter [Bacteroidia bacterium]|nr:TCR/Tet family MFS transporter [Bacteroidia bacterium]
MFSKKREAALGFIFITVLIDVIGFGIIIPVIPKLITQLTGGTLSDASLYGGLLMFAFSIMQFLFSPVMGSLSDQYGRRPVLLFSLFGFGLDYLVLAFAPSIAWLFIARIFAGITGASFGTATAYIADISAPEKRAQNFGLIGAAFGLGFIIGPVIGGVLGEYGPRIPFIAAAALTFINWLYGYFILPESLKPENRRKFDIKRANPIGSLQHLKKYPVILGLVVSLVCIYIAQHAVQSNWTYFTMEKFKWDEAMVGYSLGVVGVLVAIVQGGLIRIVTPKLGAKRSVYFGLGLYLIGFILFAFASTSWMMFAFLVPYCLGGISMPALQGIMSNQVPANEQGELQGALTSLMSATSIIGPPLMTSIFAYYTGKGSSIYFPGAPFIMGALFTLFSLIFALRSLSHYTPTKP